LPLQEPDVFFSFGCHPRVACDYNDDVEKIIIDRLSNEKVVAMGEMGLDYSAK
jgi:TatD DNase family protein